MAAMYYDAKPSMTDGDNIFESKHGAGGGPGSQEPTKYDFERAKLKFDRSTAGKGGSAIPPPPVSSKSGTKGVHSSTSSASKRNSGDCSLLLEKKSYNEAVQMFDENMKRSGGGGKEGGANFMKTSMNLDGLKVSDDEVSNRG